MAGPPGRARPDRRADARPLRRQRRGVLGGHARPRRARRTSRRCCATSRARAPFAILDLGCGPGRDLATFRDLGHEAIGVDGAARFVAMARAHSGCEVWQQNLLALALPAGTLRRHLRQRRAAARARERAAAGAGRAAGGAAPARRAVQLDPARPRRGRLEQRPLQRLSRASRPGSATAPRPASSSSSTTTGPKAGRASSSRGWRASGGAATIRRAEPPQGALMRVMPPRVST